MTNATTVTPGEMSQAEGPVEQGRADISSTEDVGPPLTPAPSMLAMYRAGWKVSREMFHPSKVAPSPRRGRDGR